MNKEESWRMQLRRSNLNRAQAFCFFEMGRLASFLVGLFPKFSGEEFENFMAVAEKLCSDYEFGNSLDAKFLPCGDSAAKGPIVRLFNPFDELVVDFQVLAPPVFFFQVFSVEALQRFIEDSRKPLVTIFDQDPAHHPYVYKFFNGPDAKDQKLDAVIIECQKRIQEARQSKQLYLMTWR